MSDCILWSGATSDSGYGQKWHNGKMHSAHRLAFSETFGPIPKGLMVLHKCDVKLCINPEHLYLGTAMDNARDAVNRGQIATGARHGTHTQPGKRKTGQMNHNARLTVEQVAEIRRLRSRPKVPSLKELAFRYGTTISTISRAARGDTYNADALIAELAKP